MFKAQNLVSFARALTIAGVFACASVSSFAQTATVSSAALKAQIAEIKAQTKAIREETKTLKAQVSLGKAQAGLAKAQAANEAAKAAVAMLPQ